MVVLVLKNMNMGSELKHHHHHHHVLLKKMNEVWL